MNSKILVSLLVIGLTALAISNGITGAFFSDTETSNANTFSAGSLDLKIDSKCSYNGMACTNGHWGNEQGTTCTCAWEPAKDLTGAEKLFDYTNILPGDYGNNSISFHIYTDAWACLSVGTLTDSDNGCTDAELATETGCTENGDGELDNHLQIMVWIDTDCDNVKDEGEQQFQSYTTLSTLMAQAPGGTVKIPIADKSGQTLVDHKLAAGAYCVGIAWQLPGGQNDNEIQTDKLMDDLTFEVIQAANNDYFTCN